MTGSSKIVLATLAILKVDIDQDGRDYIDYFVPFAAEALRSAPNGGYSVEEVQARIKAAFGLAIPQGPLKQILNRSVRRGYAARSDNTYIPLAEGLAGLDFERRKTQALNDLAIVVRGFQDFSSARLEVTLTEDEATSAILAYIQNRGPDYLRTVITKDAGVPLRAERGERIHHAVNGFVVELLTREHPASSAFVTLIKGSLIASVLYAQDLQRVGHRLNGLEVYLDTRFLLRALGLEGPQFQNVSGEVLTLGKGLGAHFYYFDCTFTEMRNVLLRVSHGLKYRAAFRQPLGTTGEYLASIGYKSSDVEVLINDLAASLRDLGINLRQRPPHDPRLTLDEPDFTSRLGTATRYRSDEAIQHDIAATTAVHRIRRGNSTAPLEHTKAIFVTTNSALAATANRVMSPSARDGFQAPVAYTDSNFATIAWLKSPSTAPDLPSGMIIADSYAALNPPDSVWKQYLAELDKLIELQTLSEDDYFLLRFSSTAKSVLMDVANSKPDALHAGIVPQVLERTRTAIVHKAEPELLARGAELGRAEMAAAVASEVQKRTAEERKRLAAEKRQEAKALRQAAKIRRLARRAGIAAGVITALLLIVMIALLAVASSSVAPPGNEVPVGIVVAGLAYVLTGALSLVTGGSVLAVATTVRDNVAARIEKAMVAGLEIEQEFDTHELQTVGPSE